MVIDMAKYRSHQRFPTIVWRFANALIESRSSTSIVLVAFNLHFPRTTETNARAWWWPAAASHFLGCFGGGTAATKCSWVPSGNRVVPIPDQNCLWSRRSHVRRSICFTSAWCFMFELWGRLFMLEMQFSETYFLLIIWKLPRIV